MLRRPCCASVTRLGGERVRSIGMFDVGDEASTVECTIIVSQYRLTSSDHFHVEKLHILLKVVIERGIIKGRTDSTAPHTDAKNGTGVAAIVRPQQLKGNGRSSGVESKNLSVGSNVETCGAMQTAERSQAFYILMAEDRQASNRLGFKLADFKPAKTFRQNTYIDCFTFRWVKVCVDERLLVELSQLRLLASAVTLILMHLIYPPERWRPGIVMNAKNQRLGLGNGPIVYQMISSRQPPQETLQRLATKCSYAPAQLVDPELQEICPLKMVESRLARKFGMTSASQGIDSESCKKPEGVNIDPMSPRLLTLFRNDPLTTSRANIGNILHSLIDNPGIERGNNTIVYYAGRAAIDRDTIDTDGPPIHDIYDRELNAPFTEIFRSNGHKITFFADCCHVSGMSRDPDPEIGLHFTCATRPGSNINDMLRAADESLSRHLSVLSKNQEPDMGSHVILAVCRNYQYAKETFGKEGYDGAFTRSLVKRERLFGHQVGPPVHVT
ncbi:hypothetical protein EV421DRAFT_2022352 [Armillaria borealis]|uniref:Uncharacterized protein n=1 Tax=Armillaria borealis TaxID=47425 RepID=A0AA39J5W1_9AGAR|nr:hypothetical protein EV421DRAFT_2022352 [Armillaria borealis]